MHCLFEIKIASFRLELGYAWEWHCSYTVSAASYRNRHSSFSWTILSGEERCNQANPMWNTNLWNKARPQHRELVMCLGSVPAPANYVTLKMQEMELTFIVLMWKELLNLNYWTIFRFNYKDSTFSSVTSRPQVLVWAWTFSSLVLYQLS